MNEAMRGVIIIQIPPLPILPISIAHSHDTTRQWKQYANNNSPSTLTRTLTTLLYCTHIVVTESVLLTNLSVRLVIVPLCHSSFLLNQSPPNEHCLLASTAVFHNPPASTSPHHTIVFFFFFFFFFI